MTKIERASDTESIADDNLSVVCMAPDSPDSSVASLSSEPMDRLVELESIVDQMRTFISSDNRQNNVRSYLEIACKDEQIEDAVYALGTIFYLNFNDPRGRWHVRFTLSADAPTVVDEDEVRQIIYGDLLHTPIRALAKKLRLWIADPNGAESIRVQKVARIQELCWQFKLQVTAEKDGVLLTKSRKFKGPSTVIDEKKVESVLREKRKKAVTLEKRLFLKTHRATAPTPSQSASKGPLSSLHSITNELRSFVADTDGPRSMTISKSSFSPEVYQLAAVFSLAVTPESDAIVLTKQTQGPFVVSETRLADVLNRNGKRPRGGSDDGAEMPPESPLPSDGEETGPATSESRHETHNLEQEIRKFVLDAQGPTSMTLYCPNNAKSLAVFLLAHAFKLIYSETPGRPYAQLTRTANSTRQNIDEVSVKRLLKESHPSFRAAQLIDGDSKRVSDIKAFEQCLRAFLDDVEAKAFSIPATTDPRVTALAKAFHLKVNQNGDWMILHRKVKGRQAISEKKLARVLAMPERRRKKQKTTISAPSSSAEDFPDIELPALSLWLRAFVNNAQGPLEMTIPPTSQKTQEDVTKLAAAFGLDAAFNNGFTNLRKTGRGVDEWKVVQLTGVL
ncbi:uncharacterized protein EV420DRAFT_409123 [Desarmillaria tabescens]|uniref:Uncharacterized protein n=1 Tax=Armillaria tabescens TaxID=1929756 RepID=A0AA39KC26_ARMTA|nr:uncharacterized protein EV420DRAFT_409123 [Desarmillaria tabescens]KAK0458033.1 hypothetical protein EV420DRAFT_409123 [Desarmillaria tabescens]